MGKTAKKLSFTNVPIIIGATNKKSKGDKLKKAQQPKPRRAPQIGGHDRGGQCK